MLRPPLIRDPSLPQPSPCIAFLTIRDFPPPLWRPLCLSSPQRPLWLPQELRSFRHRPCSGSRRQDLLSLPCGPSQPQPQLSQGSPRQRSGCAPMTGHVAGMPGFRGFFNLYWNHLQTDNCPMAQERVCHPSPLGNVLLVGT
eukprot:RCo015316